LGWWRHVGDDGYGSSKAGSIKMADWTTPSAIHSKCGESTYQKAIYTIDENTGTYWQHPTTQYHWIIFDMGETKRITQVRLYSDGTYRFGRTTGLYVYVGDDPADLGDAVLEDIVDATGWWESGAFDKNGRYIKLLSKSNSADQLIYEFDAMRCCSL
jgi:hypothetical protein